MSMQSDHSLPFSLERYMKPGESKKEKEVTFQFGYLQMLILVFYLHTLLMSPFHTMSVKYMSLLHED